ncbi:hypothetical protein FHH43_02655, partial [Clostridium perfringens]|nr:hypothetical protein [Clostridium perfringens]
MQKLKLLKILCVLVFSSFNSPYYQITFI